MNTQDVANKWPEMCRKGENIKFIEQLYADNITSKEMSGFPEAIVSGKTNVMKKAKYGWIIWKNFIKKHKQSCSCWQSLYS